MSQIQYIDELIREYLLFRGFSATLKAFDAELKVDKEKGFRVDKIVDQLMQFIYVYDLVGLRELWSHLDQRMFSKLENDFAPAVRKLENSVLKLYLVNAVSNNKADKVSEFFTKMTPDLQGQAEWKEWFMLPYIKNPEESLSFAVHFTRQWQDTLLVSLHNFLAIIYQAMPLPVLASYEEEATRIRHLQEENESLKHKLATLQQRSGSIAGPEVPPPPEIMDDFYIIAQETSIGPEIQGKSLKNLIRTIGGGLPTSPIMTRKSLSASQEQSHKRHSSKPRMSTTPTTSWIKSVSGESVGVAKRSVSLEARSRSSRAGPREASLDRTGKLTRQEFLLLSQEELNEHKAAVTQCCFNAAGSTVASCDTDGFIKLWSPSPAPKLLSSVRSKSGILCLDWVTKNERYVVSGSQQGFVGLYDMKERKTIWEVLSEEKCKVVGISCSPSESSFVCACVTNQNQGKLMLYDIKTKKLDRILSLGPGGPNLIATCCKYNHNGQLLIAGCSDGTVRTLDLRHSECIDSWSAHQGSVQAMHLTPDQNSCYTLGTDNKLYRHSLNQTKQPVWETALSDCPLSFTLDQSANHILLCGQSGANIYQVTLGGLSMILQLCRTPMVSCDWANANQCGTCVTASSDGKIKVSTVLMP